MSGSWLNVPHFQQEFEYSCVAACARMVLTHYGDVRTEAECDHFSIPNSVGPARAT